MPKAAIPVQSKVIAHLQMEATLYGSKSELMNSPTLANFHSSFNGLPLITHHKMEKLLLRLRRSRLLTLIIYLILGLRLRFLVA
jgi:hypothetical protein